MEIRKGTQQDIEEVAALYDELNDYLESMDWIGTSCISICCRTMFIQP